MANGSLLNGPIDATHPQALIYEPSSNGQHKLVGAEFIILASALPPNSAPQVEGHLMLYVDGPNRAYRRSMNCTSGRGATILRGPSWTETTTYPAQPDRVPGDACLAVLFPVSDAERHY
jgi:hypothetical protein